MGFIFASICVVTTYSPTLIGTKNLSQGSAVFSGVVGAKREGARSRVARCQRERAAESVPSWSDPCPEIGLVRREPTPFPTISPGARIGLTRRSLYQAPDVRARLMAIFAARFSAPKHCRA